MKAIRIALIGDCDETVVAHQAIPRALQLSAEQVGIEVNATWLPTDQIHDTSWLKNFDALWCVPASPYRSMDGALLAIRYARENNVPFLGTCGGFQHAVIEYARNVLGWYDADHAETSPDAARSVIALLTCSLVEKSETLRLQPHTKLANAYGTLETHEGYHCSYGINPQFREALTAASLKMSAEDNGGELRAVELDSHPFFVATLFQPERAALRGEAPPIVAAFLSAARNKISHRH
ncbi:MAG: CTP synthase [Gemmatimonadaceae bacterium]